MINERDNFVDKHRYQVIIRTGVVGGEPPTR